ncbi:MAG: hypothetical protein N3D15_03605 [Syntrophorhabdaceae bacterium]|nr:hypothetical protein [Syntrophorhabdaceae bacterium]
MERIRTVKNRVVHMGKETDAPDDAEAISGIIANKKKLISKNKLLGFISITFK